MTLTIAVDTFEYIRECVNQRILEFANESRLYVTAASKEELWDTYLYSFPPEERQSHNCNTCKQFIRRCGGVVRINNDLSLSTVWDTVTEGPYAAVGQALRELVLTSRMRDIFVTDERKSGNFFNFAQDEAGNPIKWTHFCLELNRNSPHFKHSPETFRNEIRTLVGVFKRGLETLTEESLETVLELIAQNSLYRGDSQRQTLESFLMLMQEYKTLNAQQKEAFLWKNAASVPHLARLRNTSIGTLLVDISEGVELDKAVFSYESKMDPVNYKRPRPVVTENTLEKARQTLEGLGLLKSLERRYATPHDLTVNNYLFVDRSSKSDDIFTQLKEEQPISPRNLSKTQEIPLTKFINDVLPTANSIEVLLESRLVSNFMVLVSAADPDSPTFFKWDNGVTWYYNGAVADSIKEKVAKAGGNVTGLTRISLSWSNHDDLDLHLETPQGKLYYGNKCQAGGELDVDQNFREPYHSDAVENIIFPTKMVPGKYNIRVDNYRKRQNHDQGYTVELEHNGELRTYHSETNQTKTVATFDVKDNKIVNIVDRIPREESVTVNSKKMWGLSTNCFHKVKGLTLSPNYWGVEDNDADTRGNKHFFFLLDGVQPEGDSRPFLNEYIKDELLRDHKRVFELLGGRVTVTGKPELAGLGFSASSPNYFYCRVSGSFNRVLKVVV